MHRALSLGLWSAVSPPRKTEAIEASAAGDGGPLLVAMTLAPS
jgi:hypothetical protein